jgi:tetratricopeptide (TPR) repeat protein
VRGEDEKAIADFTGAMRVNPQYAKAYYHRGQSYTAQGQYEKAIADCTEAIRLEPGEPLFYFGRAQAYRAFGNQAEARRDERRFQELMK